MASTVGTNYYRKFLECSYSSTIVLLTITFVLHSPNNTAVSLYIVANFQK